MKRNFANAVRDLMDNPELRKRMGEIGRKRVEDELQWSVVGQTWFMPIKP